MKNLHIIFTGTVQGVYFRATCQQIARESGLVGWVRNLPDGRVEMRVSGLESQVDGMMEKLEGRFKITGKEFRESNKLQVWDDFRILRGDGDEDPFA